MQAFSLDSRMLTLRGVFYPTGYVFVMLPSQADAEQLDRELHDTGYDSQHPVMMLPSDTILHDIGGTVRHDSPSIWPSIGTEAATVLEYEQRAEQGQCALMIHAPTDDDTRRVMEAMHHVPFTYAQRYHRLVIEDLH